MTFDEWHAHASGRSLEDAWNASESERTRTMEIRNAELVAERNEYRRLTERHQELRQQAEAQCDRLRAQVQEFQGSTGPNRSTLVHIHREVIRARMKHPGNAHLLGALMEEVGELAKELLEGTDNVYGEAKQVACVAIRIMEEGDGDYE